MLCDENGMASHWRLLPVVLRIGRRQPHANEILAMTAYHIQALVRHIFPVRGRKAKAAPKLRFAEPQKCRVKCSLVRHGLRYIFFHHPLVFLNLHATARPPQPIKPLRANYTILRRFAANPIHIQSPSNLRKGLFCNGLAGPVPTIPAGQHAPVRASAFSASFTWPNLRRPRMNMSCPVRQVSISLTRRPFRQSCSP